MSRGAISRARWCASAAVWSRCRSTRVPASVARWTASPTSATMRPVGRSAGADSRQAAHAHQLLPVAGQDVQACREVNGLRGSRRKGSGCRCRRRITRSRALNPNDNGRSCLEEAERRIRTLGWSVGIEPEIVQRAPADRIRVLVLRESFRVPGQRTGSLRGWPRCAGVSRISHRPIVGPSRFLRGGMKSDITHGGSSPQRHTEGLNRAIQVLVINRVLVMPDTG